MYGREHWADWVTGGPASVAALEAVEAAIGRPLPKDYKDFLLSNDGGEGFISVNYLILWKAEELVGFNREYEVEKYASGFFLFGSDGGGEGYAFDMRGGEPAVVAVPFVGMSLRYASPCAPDFQNFLRTLAEQG